MNQTINRKDNTEAKTAHWEHWKLGQLHSFCVRTVVTVSRYRSMKPSTGTVGLEKRNGDMEM